MWTATNQRSSDREQRFSLVIHRAELKRREILSRRVVGSEEKVISDVSQSLGIASTLRAIYI